MHAPDPMATIAAVPSTRASGAIDIASPVADPVHSAAPRTRLTAAASGIATSVPDTDTSRLSTSIC
jgi:hypothetical protein